ncbi:MAG: hypothetical protein HC896_06020 [Bacteroidales bacterium]|nr:hypothetical protein [Bacteroidales bacterium]
MLTIFLATYGYFLLIAAGKVIGPVPSSLPTALKAGSISNGLSRGMGRAVLFRYRQAYVLNAHAPGIHFLLCLQLALRLLVLATVKDAWLKHFLAADVTFSGLAFSIVFWPFIQDWANHLSGLF